MLSLRFALVVTEFPRLSVLLAVISTIIFSFPDCAAQDYKQIFVTGHNGHRAYHKAPPMQLNDTMNIEAQRCAEFYAAKKVIDHSCESDKMGENLYSIMSDGGRVPSDNVYLINDAIKGWYDEVKDYNYLNPDKQTGVVGHFTQLVWIESTQLGVGVARSSDNMYGVVVGKYYPQGNFLYFPPDLYKLYKDNVKPPDGFTSFNHAPRSTKQSSIFTVAIGVSTLVLVLFFRFVMPCS